MVISVNRDNNLTASHKLRWRGFRDGQTRRNDQIACGVGKAGNKDSHHFTIAIFCQSFTTRLYAGTVVCHFDSATVFPDRLPRNCATAGGFHGLEGRDWVVENSALHNPSKSAGASAKKGLGTTCWPAFSVLPEPMAQSRNGPNPITDFVVGDLAFAQQLFPSTTAASKKDKRKVITATR